MRRKRRLLGLILVSVCVGLGIPVHAQQQYTASIEITDDNRFDSRYYKDIPVISSGEQLERAGDTTDLQGLEDALLAGWDAFKGTIDVSAYRLPVSEASTYLEILNDHPEAFYVTGSVSYSYSGSFIRSFTPQYTTTDKAEVESIMTQCNAAVQEALALIDPSMDDYEKALAVHDWLAVYCEYDYQNYLNGSVPAVSHTMQGSLVNRIAVCDGYAKAYKYIMQNKLGIDCYLVSSESMGHAWDLIVLDDTYYHVDVTWDDPAYDRIGRVTHKYFLLSDTGICQAGNQDHDSGDKDVEANDSSYEAGLWINTSTSLVYENGYWYYIDNTQNDTKRMRRTANLLGGSSDTLSYDLGRWSAGGSSYWSGGFSNLQKYYGEIVVNTAKAIYSVDLTGNKFVKLYEPTDLLTEDADCIYGFRIRDNVLHYYVNNTANLSGYQSSYIHETVYPGKKYLSGSAQVTGTNRYGETLAVVALLPENISGAFSYQWYRNGEEIAGASDSTYQLTAADIGKVIRAKVCVDGYEGDLQAETETIQKGILTPPSVNIQLQGKRGKALSTIQLAEGYAWTNPETVPDTCGTFTYGLTYCTDPELYEIVEGLEGTVVVTCEEHEYDEGTVTKQPTTEAPGVLTFRCRYCDETRTEEIPQLEEVKGSVQIMGTARYQQQLDAMVQLGENISGAISYQWYRDQEAIADAVTSVYRIKREDIGKVLRVTVLVDGYVGQLTAETQTVQKALTAAPEDELTFEGKRGQKLSEIVPGNGYSWRRPDQVLINGTYEYELTYCTDPELYEPAADIWATVTVTCQEHEYDEGEITLEATVGQEGVRTYHCKYCENTWEETIPKRKELSGNVQITGENRYQEQLQAVLSNVEEQTGTFAFAWYCDAVLITGETTDSYLVRAEDIGKVISVKVTRDGYEGQLSAETETIRKALVTPSEKISAEGVKGKTLSSITLKNGYAWADPDMVMEETGTFVYGLTYCMDPDLYELVENLSATVVVKCEAHVYDEGTVLLQPTVSSSGIRLYHCLNCPETKTETIDPLNDEEQGGSQNEGRTQSGEQGGNQSGSGESGSQQEQGENQNEGGTQSGSGESGSQQEQGGNQNEGGTQSGTGENGSQQEQGGSQNEGRTQSGEQGGNQSGTGENGSQQEQGGNQSEGGNQSGTGENGSQQEQSGSSQSESGSTQQEQTTVSLSKGQILTDASGNQYKITKVSKSNIEASFIGNVNSSRKSIVIPDSVKYQGKSVKIVSVAKKALKGNKKVTSVTIGKNITSIGVNAFYGCTKLKTIAIKSTKIKTFGKYCMKNIRYNATIKCPKSVKKVYKKQLTSKTGFTKWMKLKTS